MNPRHTLKGVMSRGFLRQAKPHMPPKERREMRLFAIAATFASLVAFPSEGKAQENPDYFLCENQDYEEFASCVRIRLVLDNWCEAALRGWVHYSAECRPRGPEGPLSPVSPNATCSGWLQNPRTFWECLKEQLDNSQTCAVWMDQFILRIYATCQFVEPDSMPPAMRGSLA